MADYNYLLPPETRLNPRDRAALDAIYGPSGTPLVAPPTKPPVFANNAPADSSLVGRILGVEGTSQAQTSSAVGPGQFIRSTWLDMVRKYRPDLAQGRSDSQILQLRTDPAFAALGKEMTGAYARENQGIIQGAGYDPNPGNTYLAHFVGPGGAVKLLAADPNTPVSQILPQAVAANPFLRNMTAQNAIDWASGKMRGVSAEPPNPENSPQRYGQGETPALGTPPAPALPTPSQPVPSAPAAAPSGLGGLLARLVGAQPTLAPVAGVLGIPGQPPQGAPASPMGALSAYQPEQPPALEMPAFDQLQFAGQQPVRLTRPQVKFGRGFY